MNEAHELNHLNGKENTSTVSSLIIFDSNQWGSTAVFVAQVVIVYIVIFAALLNLTLYPNSKQELWITLLSSSIGYLLPSPYLKKAKLQPIENAI